MFIRAIPGRSQVWPLLLLLLQVLLLLVLKPISLCMRHKNLIQLWSDSQAGANRRFTLKVSLNSALDRDGE
jgi:hypothetical protein